MLYINLYQIHVYNTGILLYSETDLQHADFWVKSEGREQVLSSFQESWRLGYIHFAHDYAYTFVQHKVMFLDNNDMLNCHTSCRFALSHEGNKCRRETIVQYFGEDVSAAVLEEGCCDVCLSQPEMVDYQDEVLAVIKVVQEIPGYGEQVCMNE